MAHLTFKLNTDRARPWAGTLRIEATTDEEKVALAIFKSHIGNTMRGDVLDVVYPWRPNGRERRERSDTGAGA